MPRRRSFGETTPYQKEVNALVGAMGPTRGAFWRSYTTTTGNPTSLGAQPLYYNPALGEYVTSYSQNADKGSVNFSGGFGRRRKLKSRKGLKRSSRKRSSRKRSSRKRSSRKRSSRKGLKRSSRKRSSRKRSSRKRSSRKGRKRSSKFGEIKYIVSEDEGDGTNWEGRTVKPDETKKIIKTVEFGTDRYGYEYHKISFKEPVTEKDAVIAAEKYLNSIEYNEDGPPALFLEKIKISDNGDAVLVTGS